MSKADYIPTIGIECHVQLKTKTKLFAAVGNDSREAEPNSLISHICVGMPGALPYLNKAAVELSARAAYALGTEPQQFSKFDRKHYFYPDLPKGYQISQYDQPIIVGGFVEIEVDGQKKRIGITRAHLEEDAGKNTHPAGADYSLVDLNRAGTPLLEIVSEPDMHSAAEAKAFVKELYLLMKFGEISDCDLYHGNMRFDVNVSVSKDPGSYGKRAEVKNLNSFRSVENAILYEIDRQIELLESGQPVVQETRGWDEDKQKTTLQRSKEEAQDYRYMPEPDVPPVVLSDEFLQQIKESEPALPAEYRDKFRAAGIDNAVIEALLEQTIPAKFLFTLNASSSQLKAIANLLSGVVQNLVQIKDEVNNYSWETLESEGRLDAQTFIELVSARHSSKISSTIEKQILLNYLKDGQPISRQIESQAQVSDEEEIEKIVAEVISENLQAAEDVKNGEEKAIGFLVGQVMKKSHGKANPGLAQQIIKKQL